MPWIKGKSIEEVTLAVAEREKVKERFIHATYLIVLQGWVDAEEKQNLLHVLNDTVSEEDIYNVHGLVLTLLTLWETAELYPRLPSAPTRCLP